jgi:hypothetical protein
MGAERRARTTLLGAPPTRQIGTSAYLILKSSRLRARLSARRCSIPSRAIPTVSQAYTWLRGIVRRRGIGEIMRPEEPADIARARRLAEIRGRRGTAKRLSAIESIRSAKPTTVSRGAADSSGRKTPENSSDMFGHQWQLWFQMRDVGYEFIIARARQRRKTTYAELWDAIKTGVGEDLGNHWRQLPSLLGYIGDLSYEKIRLIVTVLVIYQERDEHPGPGFFRLAASHDLMPSEEAPPAGKDAEWKGMTSYQRAFWDYAVDRIMWRWARLTGFGPVAGLVG